MATDWFVLVPQQSEENVAGVVPDAFIVSVTQGSAIDNQLDGNYTGQVTVNGKTGYLRAGPFTSLADAQAYLKVGAQNASVIPGVTLTPAGSWTGPIPDVAGAISALAGVLKGIGDNLFSAAFWVSVGWGAAGALALLAGIYLLLRKQDLAPPLPAVIPIPL